MKNLTKHDHRMDIDMRSALLGKLGTLEVRLAANAEELASAQTLRYQVFYEEMSATDMRTATDLKLDQDRFDAYCDHIIVVETAMADETANGERIVGTYRLLRQEVAEMIGGFYTQDEFDIDSLVKQHPGRRFLELGRSCVIEEYRSKRTVELLWHGIWAYVLRHNIDVLFGCASLEGSDAESHSEELQLLSQVNPAPDQWFVSAHADRYVAMGDNADLALTSRKALLRLPPLIKGYLRLGAFIGDGAVIDEDFGTTDILMVLPVENINPRYVSYYGETAGRHAA